MIRPNIPIDNNYDTNYKYIQNQPQIIQSVNLMMPSYPEAFHMKVFVQKYIQTKISPPRSYDPRTDPRMDSRIEQKMESRIESKIDQRMDPRMPIIEKRYSPENFNIPFYQPPYQPNVSNINYEKRQPFVNN